MRPLPVLLLLAVALPAHARRPAPAPPVAPVAAPAAVLAPALEPLRPLLGSWESVPSDVPDAPTGRFTLLPDAGGHALVRRHTATTPAGVHEDLLVVYPDGDALRGLYVDDEGHTIVYDVTASADGAVLQSGGSGMRFRLTYVLAADGTVGVDFAAAPPGGDFATWIAGRARRVAP